jgi:hypothetical protein
VSFLGVEVVRVVKVVSRLVFGVFEGLIGEEGKGWREEVAGGFGSEWGKFPALPCSVFFFRFVIYAGESGIPALPRGLKLWEGIRVECFRNVVTGIPGGLNTKCQWRGIMATVNGRAYKASMVHRIVWC